MKGFVKVIIAGAVILVLGIGVLVVALGINGWQINVDEDFEMKYYECEDNNTTLAIDFSAGKLEIDYYEGETIKVEYPENERLSASISEENGKFSFSTNYHHKWNNFFGWFSKNIPTTKIWIPYGDIMNLKLGMNAGSVRIADGEYGSFDVEMNAGSISMGDIICNKLSVEVNAGSVDAKNVTSAEKVNVDMNAGSMRFRSLICPSVDISVSAGSLDFAKVETSSVDVDVSAGSVCLEMLGAKSDYTIDVDKSAGSCNISNQRGAKDKRIKADVSAGSLNIKFAS